MLGDARALGLSHGDRGSQHDTTDGEELGVRSHEEFVEEAGNVSEGSLNHVGAGEVRGLGLLLGRLGVGVGATDVLNSLLHDWLRTIREKNVSRDEAERTDDLFLDVGPHSLLGPGDKRGLRSDLLLNNIGQEGDVARSPGVSDGEARLTCVPDIPSNGETATDRRQEDGVTEADDVLGLSPRGDDEWSLRDTSSVLEGGSVLQEHSKSERFASVIGIDEGQALGKKLSGNGLVKLGECEGADKLDDGRGEQDFSESLTAEGALGDKGEFRSVDKGAGHCGCVRSVAIGVDVDGAHAEGADARSLSIEDVLESVDVASEAESHASETGDDDDGKEDWSDDGKGPHL